VKFLLKELFVWLVDTLAFPWTMWSVAPELVQQHGDLKKAETAIGTGSFMLERYDPNVKAVFTRHPEYYHQSQPYVDGVDWLVIPDESTGLAMYRTGQLDLGPQINWAVRPAGHCQDRTLGAGRTAMKLRSLRQQGIYRLWGALSL
jgi:ABC-type transport system substrate-binding protein